MLASDLHATFDSPGPRTQKREWPMSLFIIQGCETVFYNSRSFSWTLNFTVTFAHYMQNGDTPLLMAVHNGHLAVVKMLIEKYQCSANEVYKVTLWELHLSIKCKCIQVVLVEYCIVIYAVSCSTLELIFSQVPVQWHLLPSEAMYMSWSYLSRNTTGTSSTQMLLG